MSVRILTNGHMERAVRFAREAEPTDPKKLGPDEMQLYSFYKPSLVAGDYEIKVDQVMSTTGQGAAKQTLRVTNVRSNAPSGDIAPQEFEVVVPRFSLDLDMINSYYPPDGHQDEGRILPHIVINDPHYPWEIEAGVSDRMHDIVDGGRGMVPWIALIVFDPDELRISDPADLQALKIPGFTQASDLVKQNSNGSFKMQVSEYFDTVNHLPQASRVNFEKGMAKEPDSLKEVKAMTSSMQAVFPQKKILRHLFPSLKALQAHRYLSHVRHINTVGCPDAGVEAEGLFSIVVSSRTGAFDIKQPQTQVCHLVSIEHMDSTLDSINSGLETDRIGLVSLFSWVYTALPPDPVNFVDTMLNLVQNQQMLRTDDKKLKKLDDAIASDIKDASQKHQPVSAKTQASQLLSSRLHMGYTLARWRPETGEESAAFNRGPLVPQPVPAHPVGDLPDCSNTSKEFQVLDTKTGVMDLSYSSAWQVGKLLAISDTVFSAALMRFRSTIHRRTASKTRMFVNDMPSARTLISNVAESLKSMRGISSGQTDEPRRVIPSLNRTVTSDLNRPDVLPVFIDKLAKETDRATSAGKEIFTEFNQEPPNSTDWAIITKWLSEKMLLGDIPPQMLIPEPSFIPPEGLRFFYIDDFWLDCLIDGALSAANHLDREDDYTRQEIKRRFNDYLRTVVPEAGIKPQIPSYGFILRSQLVKVMPDLRITVTYKIPDPAGQVRHPVCRYTRYDATTILCLLDRLPQEIDSITLAQPPHQQRFSLGYNLTPSLLEFRLIHLYTQNAPKDKSWPELPDQIQPHSDKTKAWFDWPSRCVNVDQMANDINGILQFPEYIDTTANSCELGLELNDPSYLFIIQPPLGSDPHVPARDRQLYINTASPTRLSTAPKPMLDPSTLNPLPARGPTSPFGSPLPPSSQPPPAPTPLPVISNLSPPRPTRIQPLPRSLTLPPHTLGAADPQSRFDLSIYPSYKTIPPAPTKEGFDPTDYIPTLNLFYYDLIFSIRKKTIAAASSFALRELRIEIPTTGSAANIEALLDQNYDGGGVRMLSNQRFIPFLFSGDTAVTVRLIPRTAAENTTLVINDRKTTEMGFRLAEANVSNIRALSFVSVRGERQKQQRGLVEIKMVEVYAMPQGDVPVTTKWNVVKQRIRDGDL
ncbi:hypothetical protein MMC30_005404 [Trapelia coarctata]|nr:hypothetical protein [Trapelia coarctata]